MKCEIGHLVTLAVQVNRISKLLGEESLCYWYTKDGKRYLSMFEGRSTHEVPNSFDLSEIEEKEI